jgi:hypothetical protein
VLCDVISVVTEFMVNGLGCSAWTGQAATTGTNVYTRKARYGITRNLAA